MELGDILNAAKAFTLTDEQKASVKKIVKEAAGNKSVITAELKKVGINVSDNQIDSVIAMVDKL